MSPARHLFLLAVFGTSLAGCGGRPAEPTEARGQVVFRGEPLLGGLVVFTPDADRGSSGPLLQGRILPDGCFTLSGPAGESPAPGFYRVAVAPRAGAYPPATPANPHPGPPARYRDPGMSDLRAEIKPGRDNVFRFEMGD